MLDKHLLRGDILEALQRVPPAVEDLRLMLEVAFPADIAEIISDLPADQQLVVLRSLDPEDAADVVGEAPEWIQRDLLLNLLTRREITGILNEMAPDEGADLVALLPPPVGEKALENLEPEQAEAIRSLVRHDPETAGGIMTTEFVTVSPDLTVGQALAHLRTSLELESISNVYVVDDDSRLRGVLSMRDILEAPPAASVSDVMFEDMILARVDDDQEVASRLLDRYDLTSLPVVDDRGSLRGVITADDAMDVLEEEAEEDLAFLSGSGVVSVRDPVSRHLAYRLPWLLITLGGGVLAAVLVKHFQPTLDRVEELVFFMPVMAGMAGNVGIQSSTVMVRGFATGEMVMSIAVRTLARQLLVGVLVGTICGTITGGLAVLLTGEIRVGVAVSTSMLVGITSAAAVGTLLPIGCHRAGVDPAVASGPFVTTLNDLIGLFIYFSVATLLLLKTKP
jgi:magnesium transporter